MAQGPDERSPLLRNGDTNGHQNGSEEVYQGIRALNEVLR